MSDEKLIPVADTEAIGLGVGRRSIGRLIKAGKFPPTIRLNGRLYVQKSELDAFKSRIISENVFRAAEPNCQQAA